MKGSHHAVVQNRRVRFEFSVRRNITSADVGELLGVSQPRARAIVHDMLEAGCLSAEAKVAQRIMSLHTLSSRAMPSPNIKPFAPIVPMVYCYTTPGVTQHDGWCKMGYTEKQTDTLRSLPAESACRR